MASVAMLIGGALVNALAFTGSSYCSIDYQRIALMLRERDMMQQQRSSRQPKSSGHISVNKKTILSINSLDWSKKQKPNSQS